MPNDTILPVIFPAVGCKKLVAAFDGGRITSDGGVLLLGAVERRLGIAAKLARLIADPRNPALVTHSVDDILRARILAIARGDEDADELDHLRTDPAFKLACHRRPDSGGDLCSQPTVSRWENAPTLREVVRMSYAMIDFYCASYARPPAAVTLDIDDTPDIVHGHQQLALFNSHYGERGFLPIHVDDTATGRPVAVLLRPGKTPSGKEIRGHLRRLVRRIRLHWPDTRRTIRGDSHDGRPAVMAWCEANGLADIFGLAGNAVLDRLVEPIADAVRVRRALTQAPGRAPLHRDPLRRALLARRTPCCRAPRGHAARPGHPLRGHQPAPRRGGRALCDPVLRTRTGRKSDQAAQGPACLRPHPLPRAARQPGASDPAHGRLLAAVDRPQRHPQAAASRHRRVHHPAAAPDQDRRVHHRDRHPGPHRLHRCLPGG
jgi:hypothetical protein